MNRIKAVIFDMDGVLIDAKEWHYEALNKALGIFGMEISRYDHLVTYDGLPTRKKLEMLSAEKGLPLGLHLFIHSLKQRYTIEFIHARCKPIFYHEYALAMLKAKGYRLSVCSNAVADSVKLMLTQADLLKYLEFYISNEDVESPKPDSEMYDLAISRMNLKPEECLILEDNEYGVKAALASGGHLLKINSVQEVTFTNIMRRISEIEDEERNHQRGGNGDA